MERFKLKILSKEIINLIDRNKWRNVILVGNNFKNIEHSYIHFDNAATAKTWLDAQHFENSQLLIKGSRSMQMEKILEEN